MNAPSRTAHVVIITARPEEYRAVLQVQAGSSPDSTWQEVQELPGQRSVALRTFTGRDGQPLQVAVTRAAGQGERAITDALTTLVDTYKPACIALCGACVGDPGKTRPGDVIAADRLIFPNSANTLPASKDVTTYNLRGDWASALKPFDLQGRFEKEPWWAQRPAASPAPQEPSAEDGLGARLWRMISRPLQPQATPAGTRLHIAPLGALLTEHSKTRSIDMEAAAVGRLAHARRLDAVVMRGVADPDPTGRDSASREFAARVSAECLIAFLREQGLSEALPEQQDVLSPGTAELPSNAPPSALLEARYQVVPFHGEKGTFDSLERWCTTGPAVSALLIHAESGVGKTRLAIEWTKRQRAAGWSAGFLPSRVPEDSLRQVCSLGQPVAIVIDDAESRPGLYELLEQVWKYRTQAVKREQPRMRLLLLARNADDWWNELTLRPGLGERLRELPPQEISPGVMNAMQRVETFRKAARAYGLKLRRPLVRDAPIPLEDERFNQVIYLHMAALASVEGLSFDANTLVDALLEHEERSWASLGHAAGDAPRVRQMMAVSILRGGVTGAEGDGALLPTLEPALLREALVQRVLSPRRDEDRLAEDWLKRVFPPGDEAAAVRHGLVVLGRVSVSAPEQVRPWMERLLRTELSSRALLAVEAAKVVGRRATLAALSQALTACLEASGDSRLAMALEAAEVPASLATAAVWAERTLLAAQPPPQDLGSLAERARLLERLGQNLGAMERREEALTATTEAVQLYRNLSAKDPDTFLPRLSSVLLGLSEHLGALGRAEEAMTATQEMVQVGRTLVRKHPDGWLPILAGGLNNLGLRLADVGRPQEGVEALKEAVQIRRTLVQRSGAEFLGQLIQSLSNLSSLLNQMGMGREALEAAKEVVKSCRDLVNINPDGGLAELAASLHNLGARWGQVGRLDEALKSTGEALQIYESLSQRDASFRHLLAATLQNFGLMLTEAGRPDNGLQAMRDAVRLRQVLAQENPAAHLLDLIKSLNKIAFHLLKAEQRQESLNAALQAVELSRAAAPRAPAVFVPALAKSLGNLSSVWSVLGKPQQALETMRESVNYSRALAQASPDFLPDLAMGLRELGVRLQESGRSEEAFATYLEAADIIWPLFQRAPAALMALTGTLLHEAQESAPRQRPLPTVLQQRLAEFKRLQARSPRG